MRVTVVQVRRNGETERIIVRPRPRIVEIHIKLNDQLVLSKLETIGGEALLLCAPYCSSQATSSRIPTSGLSCMYSYRIPGFTGCRQRGKAREMKTYRDVMHKVLGGAPTA